MNPTSIKFDRADSKAAVPTEAIKKTTSSQRPFGRRNFIYMGISLLLIVVGFLLMTGAPSGVDGTFNPDVFSTRRIVVGPTIAFLGFLAMAFAIICKPDIAKGEKGTADAI